MSNKKWGILVYMAADNDLTPPSINAMSRIVEAFDGRYEQLKDKVELSVYFAGNAYGYPSYGFDFSGHFQRKAKAIAAGEIFEDKLTPEEFGNESRTSPESVFRFVERCAKTKNFDEIENFALIISAHGYGFQEDSFLQDENAATGAPLTKLASEIAVMNDEYFKGKLKLIGFDSCVMNSMEVAYEIVSAQKERLKLTDGDLNDLFLVSSEGYVPLTGWSYARILNRIADEDSSALTPKKMAELFVDTYHDEYQPHVDFAGQSLDIAAVSMGIIGPLKEHIFRIGNFLHEKLKTASESEFLRLSRIILASHSQSQLFLYDQCVDIKDFFAQLESSLDREGLITDAAIRESFAAIGKTFTEETTYCKALGLETSYASGMTLYFPWSFDSYLIVMPRYGDLKFAQSEHEESSLDGWSSFVRYYLFKNARGLEVITRSEKVAELMEWVETEMADEWEMASIGAQVGAYSLAAAGGHKVNPPTNSKVNPPTNSKVNPPTNSKLQSQYIENFRRTQNIFWLPDNARIKLMGLVKKNDEEIGQKTPVSMELLS